MHLLDCLADTPATDLKTSRESMDIISTNFLSSSGHGLYGSQYVTHPRDNVELRVKKPTSNLNHSLELETKINNLSGPLYSSK